MRNYSAGVLLLSLLLLTSALAWVQAPASEMPTSPQSGVVYTSDVNWSGIFNLTEDVTIASGATLTIEPGTFVTVTGDYTIRIEGSFIALGTDQQPVKIISNYTFAPNTPPIWEGFQIAAGATADVADMSIYHARGGFDIDMGATMTIFDLYIATGFVGIRNAGTLTEVSGGTSNFEPGLTCEGVINACLIVVNGDVDIIEMETQTTGQGVRVSGGDVNIDELVAWSCGQGIVLEDGATFTGFITSAYSTSIVTASGQVDADVDIEMSAGNSRIIDVSGISGLRIGEISSDGLWTESVGALLIGRDVIDLRFSLGSVATLDAWAIDAEVSGLLDLGNLDIVGVSGYRLSGDGTVYLNPLSNFSATGFDVLGAGTLEMDNVDLTAETLGSVSGWNIVADESTLSAPAGGDGLEILSGEHQFDQVNFLRTFENTDSISVGLRVVWASVEMDEVVFIGWNQAVRCEDGCELQGDSLTAGSGGRNSGAGLVISDGDVHLDSLTTSTSDRGIVIEDGDLHLSSWIVSSAHRTYGLELDGESTAIIRDMPSYTSSGPYDVLGGGTLLWGSSGTPSMAVGSEDQFSESTVRTTDLAGNPLIDSEVTAHGFTETVDSSANANLPLLSGGSDISGLHTPSGMGAQATLSPPGGDVQIPVLPTSGDWTITTGVHAILSGGEHSLPENLTIQNGASLTLDHANLSISASAMLTVLPGGALGGDEGLFSGGSATLHGEKPLRGSGDGLTMASDADYTCYDPWTWTSVTLTGALTLSQDCDLTLLHGHALGSVNLGTDAVLHERSELNIRVLDKGVEVEGATISVSGNSDTTDSDGEAVFGVNHRTVNDAGETTVGTRTVGIQHANVTKYRSWDPSSSESMNVMISTVTPGQTSGWVRLEPVFSPYHLGDDLAVMEGTTFEIRPLVSLTAATEVTINVRGTFILDTATLQGNAWDGVRLSGVGGSVIMSNGFFSGGTLSSAALDTASLSDMTISDSTLLTNEGTLKIDGGLIHQSEACIYADDGHLILSNVTFRDCDDYAIWAVYAEMSIQDIVLDTGNNIGIWVGDSDGFISGANASQHDGDGPALYLMGQDGGLDLQQLTLSSGGSAPALKVVQSTSVSIEDSLIYGTPGALFEESTFSLTRVNFLGSGSGVGIEVQGTRMTASTISECVVDGYSVGLKLLGDQNDWENPLTKSQDTQWQTDVAFFATDIGFNSLRDTIEGEVVLESIAKSFDARIVDAEISSVNITGPAKMFEAREWLVDPSVQAVVTITVPVYHPEVGEALYEREFVPTDPIPIVIDHRIHDFDNSYDAGLASWVAVADGYLPASDDLVIHPTGEALLQITLTVNQPPTVNISEPQDGLTTTEGATLTLDANGFDPDASFGSALGWEWWLMETDGNPHQLLLSTSFGHISDLPRGDWVLLVKATDEWGGTGEDSISITVDAADSDGDFTDSCPTSGPSAWYDISNLIWCGPDIYDQDDDNDQIKDDRDDFPTDSCASTDTDNDGFPDDIFTNCETDLVVDDDDDDDGVPDNEDSDPKDPQKGRSDTPSGGTGSIFVTICSPAVVLSVLGIVVATLFVAMRSRREQDGDS